MTTQDNLDLTNLDVIQDIPEVTPNPEPADDSKTQKREGFEVRQVLKQMEQLKVELDGYKRRSEDERKAKLSEEQRIKEERDQFALEVENLRRERMQQQIAAEFKLPPALCARLIGSDEDALRADAQELAKLLPRPKVGNVTDPARDSNGGPRVYKQSQITDRAFFLANQSDILAAMREGRFQPDK